MLDPMLEDTAMSPAPWRATMTLLRRSGMEVPAAKKVRPITGSGMSNTSPASVAHHTCSTNQPARVSQFNGQHAPQQPTGRHTHHEV